MSAQKSPQRCNGRCYWFTGLPGAGKTTLADTFCQTLLAGGTHAVVLDGDRLRKGLNCDLGFSREDRRENVRRMAEVARILAESGLVVLVAAISPYRADRHAARQIFKAGQFVEVFVSTDLATCMARDPKGLYARARAGTIDGLTGWSDPYECPERSEIEIDTAAVSLAHCVDLLVRYAQEKVQYFSGNAAPIVDPRESL